MAQVKNTKDREGKEKRHEMIHFYKSREVKERKIRSDFSALARKRDGYNMHPKTRAHTFQGSAGRSVQQHTYLHVWPACNIYYNRYRSVQICTDSIKDLLHTNRGAMIFQVCRFLVVVFLSQSHFLCEGSSCKFRSYLNEELI